MTNSLFAQIEKIEVLGINTFCLNLTYCEDGERFTTKVYNDNRFQLFSVMDEALENAQADGMSIDWRSME